MSEETARFVFQDTANIIRGHGRPGWLLDNSQERATMLQLHATDLRTTARRLNIDYVVEVANTNAAVTATLPEAPHAVRRAMGRVMLTIRMRTGVPDAVSITNMYEHLRTDERYGPIFDRAHHVGGLEGRARQDPNRQSRVQATRQALDELAAEQFEARQRLDDQLDGLVATLEQRMTNAQLENGVTMEQLFGNGVPNPHGRNPVEQYRQLQRDHGGLEGDRQREAGAARALARTGYEPEQVQQYRIAWESPDVWVTPAHTYQISQMEDQHLWTTLHWIMTNIHALHAEYGTIRADTPAALQAKHWLRNQTAFRSMIQAALRRGLTFQRDHFVYLRDYVVRHDPNRGDILQETQPWRNPAMAYQRNELAGFLEEPAAVPEPEDYGKAFRSIDIDQ